MATSNVDPDFLQQSRVPMIYAVTVTGYCVALLAVALRLFTRRLTKTRIWWDGFLIVASLIWGTGIMIVVLIWLAYGIGRHIEVVIATFPNAPTVIYKVLFAGEISYSFSIVFAKLSILAFYMRIFGVTSISIPIYIVTTVVTGWLIAVLVINAFLCRPLAAFWNTTIKGQCINYHHFYLGQTIPNVITDVALLCIPLPYVWQLRMPPFQKLLVLGIFIFGGLTCVMSIVRLTYVVRLDLSDLTWNIVGFTIWSCLELWCSIICACLPSLRLLFRITRDKLTQNRHASKEILRSSINPKFRAWSRPLKQSTISPTELLGSSTLLQASSQDRQDFARGKTDLEGNTQMHMDNLEFTTIRFDRNPTDVETGDLQLAPQHDSKK